MNIEFRVWHNSLHRYIKTAPTGTMRSGVILITLDGDVIWQNEFGSGKVNAKIELYTGFKDKFGRKIFDGDFLQIEKSSSLYKVYWDIEEGMWKIEKNTENTAKYFKQYIISGTINETSN